MTRTALKQRATPLLLWLFSLAVYSINLNRLPHIDELYHMLAAQGLIATGEPAIGEAGRYWRGYPLTWLVARSIEFFGPSLAAGRLPAAVAMACLVVLLFLFLRREVDALAAWLGSGLFAVSPFAIDTAQFIRFYSLQGLAFFAGAWLIYELTRTPSWRHPYPWLLTVLALGLLGFAMHLQITTLLGIAGLATWAATTLLLTWLATASITRWQQILAIAGLVGLGVVAVTGLAATGLLARLWVDFRFAPVFNQPYVNQFWFYHAWYMLLYPIPWSLASLLTLLALIKHPRAASFVTTVFVIGFVLNSLAGSKNLRYLFYAQPFLFALWGISLAAIVAWLREGGWLAVLGQRLAARFSLLSERLAAGLARCLVVVALAYLILVNPAWLRSLTLLADITVPPAEPRTDWRAAQPNLQPWLDTVEVVVVGDDVGPLYYYGRADVLFNVSKFEELPQPRYPFQPDFRTDVPTINDVASLETVLECHASGLFLTLAQFWGTDGPLRDPAVEQLLVERAQPIIVPAESRVVAFVWQHALDDRRPEVCAALPPLAVARERR